MGRGMGRAIKIEDGNPQALNPVVIEVLRQYGILNQNAMERLRPYGPETLILNHRKERIGEIETVPN